MINNSSSRNETLQRYADTLIDNARPVSNTVYLKLGDCVIQLRSSCAELLTRLANYFSHVLIEAADVGDTADIEVLAIEREAVALDIEFIDWKREPGKTGRKDSYFDFPGGRLLRKVRTGMVFLQSQSHRIAAGPCLHNDNQVINFINAQYINWLLNRGWLICHAAGLQRHTHGLAMAGFSGGGKSTLMLHMLDHDDVNYLSNDRLFIRQHQGQIIAAGIPKLPRVNPGTIVHNPRLHTLMTDQERHAMLALPQQQLWDLEQKYDVIIDDLYGENRIVQQSVLRAFLVLNWQRNSDHPLQVNSVDIAQRRDLLAAIMKSPGPFYQHDDGQFHQCATALDESAYIDVLQNMPVFEATGVVDFDQLSRYMYERLE